MTGDILPLAPAAADDLPLAPAAAPDLHRAMIAAMAEVLPDGAQAALHLRRLFPPGMTARALLDAAMARRDGPDAALLRQGRALGLTAADMVAVALAASLERDPAMPAALRALQGDGFGPWPCLATLARALDALGQGGAPLPDLARSFALGVLTRIGDRAPAAEDRFALSPPMLDALALPSARAGIGRIGAECAAPPSWRAAAAALAATLDRPVCVVLRQGDPGDKRLFAALIAAALDRAPVDASGAAPGFGAAASIAGWLPVETIATVAGRRSALAPMPGYAGPRIVIADRDGGLDAQGWDCRDAPLPPLDKAERAELWDIALPGGAAAALHAGTRLGPSRLAAVAARARTDPTARGLRAAMGAEYRADMEPHATLNAADIDDGAFIADPAMLADLEVLLARCRFRHAPGNPIPGVRALLSGPSGTGKTMAAAWIATRLGLPLFMLDLSSVVSKYIGETEENLARILSRAETADMVLLMDEADSLFSSRTETKDSSDRFANNQTNFLLSRIETFDGIAILTSNGPERFDTAFARRLDQVIEAPMPAARERRRIWRAHLGPENGLSGADINRLSGAVDLSGGHIRNIVHTARVLAGPRPIAFEDLRRGAQIEYRKLGRTAPGGIA